MIKRDEIGDPNSCLNRAGDDEMVFSLLGRDPAFADAVRYWAFLRVVKYRKNQWADPQIVEALATARAVEKQHLTDLAEAARKLAR